MKEVIKNEDDQKDTIKEHTYIDPKMKVLNKLR